MFITGGGEGEGGGRGEEIEGFMLIQSKIYLSTISLCCIMKIKKDEGVEKKKKKSRVINLKLGFTFRGHSSFVFKSSFWTKNASE